MAHGIFAQKIQVAGIHSLDEARLVLDCGAHWLGFPLRLPVHTPDLSEIQAKSIIQAVGADKCVLITYETDVQELVSLCQFLGSTVVQLHAAMAPDKLALFRRHFKGLIIKSYVVGLEKLDPEEFAHTYSPHCDAFITDTYDARSGACGATGKTHDWAISAELVRVSPCPVIMAGGLNPTNVRQAISFVQAAAVDVHSGVEGPDGFKDRLLLEAFVSEARAGFMQCAQSGQLDNQQQ